MEELRTQFKKVFANLPIGLRRDIILVFDGQPVTWNVIWIEVNGPTEIGDKMLLQLKELDLI